ncbi:MAG: hypothetical protein KGO81_12610 [Bacteroidota bacterium]|nr:hypothetical protein [Bacteroidota bacterium]
MTIKHFNLIDGSLEFHDDKLVIFDKARRNRISLWLASILFLFYSTVTMTKGYRRHDNEGFWFGLILTMLWILISIFRRKEFQKVENEVLLSNINHVVFSIDKNDGNIIAKILTKNNLQRKIKIIKEDNQDFGFKNLLIDHKINVD